MVKNKIKYSLANHNRTFPKKLSGLKLILFFVLTILSFVHPKKGLSQTQLNADTSVMVGVFQVMDELRQVFN